MPTIYACLAHGRIVCAKSLGVKKAAEFALAGCIELASSRSHRKATGQA